MVDENPSRQGGEAMISLPLWLGTPLWGYTRQTLVTRQEKSLPGNFGMGDSLKVLRTI